MSENYEKCKEFVISAADFRSPLSFGCKHCDTSTGMYRTVPDYCDREMLQYIMKELKLTSIPITEKWARLDSIVKAKIGFYISK